MPIAAVWGATGYIGSQLVSALINSGWQVKVLVRDVDSLPSDWANHVEKHQITFQSSVQEISNALQGARLVYCCAGSTNHEVYADDYVLASESVMHSAINCGVERVVMLSTVAVYGKTSAKAITTDFPLNAKTVYGKARIASEKALISLATDSPIQLCIVRIPMVIGIGMSSKALQSLFRSFFFGIFFHPGTKDSVLNCIGISRLTDILLKLSDAKLSQVVTLLQFCDNVQWVKIVALYSSLTHIKILRIPCSARLLKLLVSLFFAPSSMKSKVEVLANQTHFYDNSSQLLLGNRQTPSTLEDIAAYITFIKLTPAE